MGGTTSVPASGTLTVFLGVRIRGVGEGGPLPALDPTVVLVKLGDVFEGLMIEVDGKNGGPRVKTETFKCPDDATSLEVERGLGNVRRLEWRDYRRRERTESSACSCSKVGPKSP